MKYSTERSKARAASASARMRLRDSGVIRLSIPISSPGPNGLVETVRRVALRAAMRCSGVSVMMPRA